MHFGIWSISLCFFVHSCKLHTIFCSIRAKSMMYDDYNKIWKCIKIFFWLLAFSWNHIIIMAHYLVIFKMTQIMLVDKNISRIVKVVQASKVRKQSGKFKVTILSTWWMNEHIQRIRKEIPRRFLERHIMWKWNLFTNVCIKFTFFLVADKEMYPFPNENYVNRVFDHHEMRNG